MHDTVREAKRVAGAAPATLPPPTCIRLERLLCGSRNAGKCRQRHLLYSWAATLQQSEQLLHELWHIRQHLIKLKVLTESVHCCRQRQQQGDEGGGQ